MDFIVNNVDNTLALGKKIGNLLNPGDIICLNGDLGAGKTHFTKGIASGLDINEYITSPTFNIVNEYDGRLKLNHFDVYRVNDVDEILEIGFDEYIFSTSVSIIEWSDYIKEIIPKEHIDVRILKLPEAGDDFRKISISYTGDRYSFLDTLNKGDLL